MWVSRSNIVGLDDFFYLRDGKTEDKGCSVTVAHGDIYEVETTCDTLSEQL